MTVDEIVAAEVSVPVPSLNFTSMTWLDGMLEATSGSPSPSRSAVTTVSGGVNVGKIGGVSKAAATPCGWMMPVSEPRFGTAMSIRPSRVKSAAAMSWG